MPEPKIKPFLPKIEILRVPDGWQTYLWDVAQSSYRPYGDVAATRQLARNSLPGLWRQPKLK